MPNFEDQPFPAAGAAPAVTDPIAFSWWGLIGTLLVFLLILFVSLWIIRYLNRANIRKMNAPWARVLDQRNLGGRQNLYLVEIAGQLQVLGGSDHHLLKISEINDPEVAAEILDEIATRPIEGVDKLRFRKKDFSMEIERLLDEGKK